MFVQSYKEGASRVLRAQRKLTSSSLVIIHVLQVFKPLKTKFRSRKNILGGCTGNLFHLLYQRSKLPFLLLYGCCRFVINFLLLQFFAFAFIVIIYISCFVLFFLCCIRHLLLNFGE